MAYLKPFVLNLADLQFILEQVNFRPLFDSTGNLVFSWDGTTAIYDAKHTLLFNPAGKSQAQIDQAIVTYGQSYAQPNAAQGLRDVSGLNNNLFQVNATWGAVDQEFLRTIAANWDNYVTTPGANYTVTFAPRGTVDASGQPIYDAVLHDVVDGTPRMISLTTTTGGVTFAKDANQHIAYDANGVASVTDWGLLGSLGQQDKQNPDNPEFFIGAQNPGVSPVNGWFAIFGQFFDHGLDFIGKASGQTITIALAPSDPLYGTPGPDGRPVTSMVITRATVEPTTDPNSDPAYVNHTSPFIDQSQTYGSNAQITSILREWVLDSTGTYHAGARMFDGDTLTKTWDRTNPLTGVTEQVTQTLPTLNELRAHLVETGRDDLTWEDIGNLRNRDMVTGDVATGAAAGNSGHALILDMNPRFDATHMGSQAVANAIGVLNAMPGAMGTYSVGEGGLTLTLNAPVNGQTVFTGAFALYGLVNFADFSIMSPPPGTDPTLAASVRAAVGEILMASVGDHYIAGDGRVNENFGLTAVHHVFHEEHNYQVENVMKSVLDQDAKAQADATLHGQAYDHSVLKAWLVPGADVATAATTPLAWDQDKLFNATKLIVEMEYQHVAVDQYARTVTPDIPEFVGYSSSVDPTVTLEYAQVAFRFGHSTLRETIDTIDANQGLTGQIVSYALKQAFLNPAQFAAVGPGDIALGMTHQQMNEIDEFVTPALNQGLLGQPLDLAAINIARGRDIGIPTLNEFRAGLGLATYTSWADFGTHMIHPENLVNFIAAYSFGGDVAKAQDVLDAYEGLPSTTPYSDAFNFMNGADKGYDKIDAWLGGLAEQHVLGGLLGETFNVVFVNQINGLMNGDRFYYLYRLFGQQFAEEVNNEQFKDIVERNTGVTHLNGSVFAYADQYYDFGKGAGLAGAAVRDGHAYGDIVDSLQLGIFSTGGASTAHNGEKVTINGHDYILDMRPDLGATGHLTGENLDGTPDSGAASAEVIVATRFDDVVYAGDGDDTIYLEEGNDVAYGGNGIDRMYGGDGNDTLYGGDAPELTDGGDGDDLIFGDSSGTAMAGMDQLIGGSGNDTIHGGVGIDKISAGAGDDVIYGEGDTDPFTRAGDGNDSVSGGDSGDLLYGDGGDDVIAGDEDQDILEGGDGDDILRPGAISQAMGGGPDEVLGGDGQTDTGFDIIEFTDWQPAAKGVLADFSTQNNPLTAIDGTTPFPAWTQMEGFVGTMNGDTAIGDAATNWLVGGSGDDRLEGGGGNDLLIGSSMKLADIVGSYAGPYTNTVDGATHRAVGLIQTNGLIDQTGGALEKHFTEMLKTELFKDYVLGDGGTAADRDTAVFSGNWREYTFQQIGVLGDGSPVLKITDNGSAQRPASDGVDIVAGVEMLHFQDRDFDISQAAVVHIVPQPAGGQPNGQLRAVVSNQQPWSPTPTYQWQRYANGGWVDVDGEKGQTYTPPAASPAVEYRVVAHAGDTLVSPETALVGTASIDTITGSSLPNIVIGLAGNDVLDGNDGADSLWGGTGNDRLTGGAGNDALDGGNQNTGGADVAVLGGAMANFTFSRNGNTVTSVDTTGAQGTDTLVNIEQVDANTTIYNLVTNGSGGSGRDLLVGDASANTLTGNGGNDVIFAGGGNDTIVWAAGDGDDTVDGGAGTDTLSITGSDAGEVFAFGPSGVTINGVPAGPASVTGVEQLAVNTRGGTDTVTGSNGNDQIAGGGGNDSIASGGGDDTITWAVGDGSDTVNGGTEGGAGDRFTVSGSIGRERFTIYAANDPTVTLPTGITANGAEIVITRQALSLFTGLPTGAIELVARLTEIEELSILSRDITNPGQFQNQNPGVLSEDQIRIVGNFAATSLLLNTITIDGSPVGDSIDISDLTSAHRIVFKSNGGNDVIVGQLRPQDVIELAAGTTPADYTSHQNADGSTTLSNGTHSITYRSSGTPTIVAGPPADGGVTPPVDDGSTPPADDGATGGDTVPPPGDDQNDDTGGDTPPVSDPVDDAHHQVASLGTASADALTGSCDDDHVQALAGDDAVVTHGGSDVVSGGEGSDIVHAGSDADIVAGGAGDDLLLGGSGADDVFGDAGSDRIWGGEGDDRLSGGAGADTVFGGAG
ncbi:peroxidase family protein, partial [Alsobacter sp. R-9]